ncbi:thioesterase family protein [Oceanicoccus sp. KOV_DT_Chl]|uniref:acyl-CoA thioesterase n=1 Tax=Oceanicoccus sp. KOV_DT_Chl TaxID=1904639 RepID=UPI000C7DF7A6|nr:thioesterase family protein [Oceanicoccus sp. KOV_DT_Chl]
MQLPVTRTPVQARYSDTDAMGHMSSGSYVTFMEVGRLDFFQQIHAQTGHSQASVVANINVDIISECRYGENIEVLSWCSRVGNKSLTVCNEIFANGRLVAKGSVVNVGFDTETRQSTAIPQNWKASNYSDSSGN